MNETQRVIRGYNKANRLRVRRMKAKELRKAKRLMEAYSGIFPQTTRDTGLFRNLPAPMARNFLDFSDKMKGGKKQ